MVARINIWAARAEIARDRHPTSLHAGRVKVEVYKFIRDTARVIRNDKDEKHVLPYERNSLTQALNFKDDPMPDAKAFGRAKIWIFYDPDKFDFSSRDAAPHAVAMNETFRRHKWIPRDGIRIWISQQCVCVFACVPGGSIGQASIFKRCKFLQRARFLICGFFPRGMQILREMDYLRDRWLGSRKLKTLVVLLVWELYGAEWLDLRLFICICSFYAIRNSLLLFRLFQFRLSRENVCYRL